jgi:hypothetical protein
MLRRGDPARAWRVGVEDRRNAGKRSSSELMFDWPIGLKGCALVGDHAEPVRKAAEPEDIFRVKEDAALAGVVFVEDLTDLVADLAGIRPRLLPKGLEGRQLRVVVGRKDLNDLGVAEPVTFRPLDRIAIHIVVEDLLGAGVLIGANDVTIWRAPWGAFFCCVSPSSAGSVAARPPAP